MREAAQVRSIEIAKQQVCITCGITIEAAQRVADEIDIYCDGPIEFYCSDPACLAHKLKSIVAEEQ